MAVAIAVVLFGGCSSGEPPAAPSSARPTAGACRTDYPTRPLPSWANSGFGSPTSAMPYVLGDRGDIVAILWAVHDPLVVPPATDRNNKILWVSRVSSRGGPLRIQATLAGHGTPVTRMVEGGPGPSIIDLPAPGCWSLDLSWGGNQDHLQLEYVSRDATAAPAPSTSGAG